MQGSELAGLVQDTVASDLSFSKTLSCNITSIWHILFIFIYMISCRFLKECRFNFINKGHVGHGWFKSLFIIWSKMSIMSSSLEKCFILTIYSIMFGADIHKSPNRETKIEINNFSKENYGYLVHFWSMKVFQSNRTCRSLYGVIFNYRVSHETWQLMNSFKCLLPYAVLDIKHFLQFISLKIYYSNSLYLLLWNQFYYNIYLQGVPRNMTIGQ